MGRTYDDGGSSAFQANATSLFFGCGFNGYGQAKWDDIRVYSRALRPPEIALLAQHRGIAYLPRQRVRLITLNPSDSGKVKV
jgi:hypothetical protein